MLRMANDRGNGSLGTGVQVLNALTVDVEDWQQSTLDNRLPISERVLTNTSRLLDILAASGVHATFFVQGLVAEKYPALVQRIAEEGHEIASHGHRHIPLFKLTPAEFAEDLRRSLEVLGQLSRSHVLGYRAPDFSVRVDTLWALRVLREHAIRYDSSIYPFEGRRYGIPGVPLQPHLIVDGLVEVPLPVVRLIGRNWPIAGGGYLRIVPYWVTRRAILRANAEGRPVVVYLHPYELDNHELERFRAQIPRRVYWLQRLNRSKTESKLRALLRDFRLAPVREVIDL